MTNIDHNLSPPPPPPVPPDRTEQASGSSSIRLVMLALGVILLGLWAGLSALVVVAALVVMIFLHELGHFVTARAAGMKCTEFFIGFGPTIWSFNRGETTYGIKAIPAGAYVKVIGMTNLEEVDPADEPRTYRQKSYWRRMSVAVAGSAMHFAIAIVCLFAILVGFGETQDDIWEVGRLAAVEPNSGSPAEAAGVQVGDDIVALDGTAVGTFDDMRDLILGHQPGDEVVLTVQRGGAIQALPVKLGDNGNGGAFLGVGPEYPMQTVSPLTALPRAIGDFGTYSWESGKALVNFFSPSGLSDFVGIAVHTTDGDATGEGAASGQATNANENRVLSIYGAARLGSQAADTGVLPLLGFIALINIFIGIFNLVPLLPLDGGHVAVATYERIRELMARSHTRYHADVGKLLPLTYVVVFVLVSVGLVALYLDIADPINLN